MYNTGYGQKYTRPSLCLRKSLQILVLYARKETQPCSPGDLHSCVTENMVTQWRTYLNPNSLLPLLSSVKLKKEKKNSPRSSESCSIAYGSCSKGAVFGSQMPSQNHGCRRSAKQEAKATRETDRGLGRRKEALRLGGGRHTHTGTFLNEDLIQLVSQGASISHA